jgi:ATP-dependent DNA helicase RecQ
LEIKNIITIVNLLRDEKILADTKDLTAFIKKSEHKNQSLLTVNRFGELEKFLCTQLEMQEKTFHIKELNELAESTGCKDVNPSKIKTIFNFWSIKNWIKKYHADFTKNHITLLNLQTKEILQEIIEKRLELAYFIVEYLYEKSQKIENNKEIEKSEILVEFSVLELLEAFENQPSLFHSKRTIDDIEDALFYLSRIDAIKIEGGFLVIYNKLSIDRLEKSNRIQYKEQDYEKLSQYYNHKIQQIHIVGEYAKKMIDDKTGALQFVDDYFHLNFPSFISKYFKGARALEIQKNITPQKYKKLFESLSVVQRKIIDDQQSKYIVVAAGPGSGKTKVLVHKLASLLLMEDVKHEQLLMLTFSRAASTEFKKRLIELIGNAAHYIDIKTFHSFCFDLLGKVGTLDKSDSILKNTIEKIRNGEVENSRITKTVLVIDEAQDMDDLEYELVELLMEKNEDMRVIAVGDDDQNIYQWRGSDSKYLLNFITEKNATKYELVTNFRSKNNIVEYTNQFVKTIEKRLKQNPIQAIHNDDGIIKIVQYSNNNLILPLVEDILSTSFSGSTCILTNKNSDAFQICGILNKHNLPTKLIQNKDGFSLYNLSEVRYFINQLQLEEDTFIINNENWENAKRKLTERYKTSTKFDIINTMIKEFEATNPQRKYKSDFEVFILESKVEDFVITNSETIFVSTIHKAKGKEFENVILFLENFQPENDDFKRLLYVAMTRAKRTLTLHYNGKYLEQFVTDNIIKIQNNNTYSPPKELSLALSHKDLNLGYFQFTQFATNLLTSGDQLYLCEDGCKNMKGDWILKFSKNFHQKLANIHTMGYQQKEAKVNFVVYWKNEDRQMEYKIVLPELYFEK